jgi:hypothetical protein
MVFTGPPSGNLTVYIAYLFGGANAGQCHPVVIGQVAGSGNGHDEIRTGGIGGDGGELAHDLLVLDWFDAHDATGQDPVEIERRIVRRVDHPAAGLSELTQVNIQKRFRDYGGEFIRCGARHTSGGEKVKIENVDAVPGLYRPLPAGAHGQRIRVG